MIDEWEARLIAASWVDQDKPVGARRELGVQDFDLGYVVWRVLPLGSAEDVGAGRAVVDRENGELTYWPSAPVESVIELYREYRREHPVAPLTWDPVAAARHDRLRAPYPRNVTHLTLSDGSLRRGFSMKGDGEPNPHILVREVLDGLPTGLRDRGGDRCSEVAVLSDLLHAEDARRWAVGILPLTVESVRGELLRGADLVTYAVREPDHPLAGEPVPPCGSCQSLLRTFGFGLQAPGDEPGGLS